MRFNKAFGQALEIVRKREEEKKNMLLTSGEKDLVMSGRMEDLESRVGRFTISHELMAEVNDFGLALLRIMSTVVVTNCTQMVSSKERDKRRWDYHYHAYSPYFDSITVGTMIPEYVCEVSANNTEVKWRRL